MQINIHFGKSKLKWKGLSIFIGSKLIMEWWMGGYTYLNLVSKIYYKFSSIICLSIGVLGFWGFGV